MYNNYGSIQSEIYEFYPLKDEGWDLLKQYRLLPKEVWQMIWNHLIAPKLIHSNIVNEQCYFNILKLGLTSRTAYHIFQIVRLKILFLKFDKLISNINDIRLNMGNSQFKRLYNYTRLLEECKYPLRKIQDSKITNEIKQYKNIVDSIIITHQSKIKAFLSSYKDYFMTADCRIIEGDYTYLCNIYKYEYERSTLRKCKIYSCAACYIPPLIVGCPLITLCCPCLCYWEIRSCGHDPDPNDMYGPLPLLCFPWMMVNSDLTYKKWYQHYSLY